MNKPLYVIVRHELCGGDPVVKVIGNAKGKPFTSLANARRALAMRFVPADLCQMEIKEISK